jgi:hypothetical protein
MVSASKLNEQKEKRKTKKKKCMGMSVVLLGW